jgi:hypothetical protein
MFNLLVKHSAWVDGRDTFPAVRFFEYTSDAMIARFRPDNAVDYEGIRQLPAVFLQENVAERADYGARIGWIINVHVAGRDLMIDYACDSSLPTFINEDFEALAAELGINTFEFSRTHWAIKEADLFRALIRRIPPRRPKPRVFSLADPERIEPALVSAMMPFEPRFDGVYTALKEAAEHAGLKCRRADDIWENPEVMQDVVNLIDRSRVVICDCSGRNPNVFYEIGIAHTLGREVILVTQAESDIPFDLRHLRFVSYLDNGEGREELKRRVGARLADIVTG